MIISESKDNTKMHLSIVLNENHKIIIFLKIPLLKMHK